MWPVSCSSLGVLGEPRPRRRHRAALLQPGRLRSQRWGKVALKYTADPEPTWAGSFHISSLNSHSLLGGGFHYPILLTRKTDLQDPPAPAPGSRSLGSRRPLPTLLRHTPPWGPERPRQHPARNVPPSFSLPSSCLSSHHVHLPDTAAPVAPRARAWWYPRLYPRLLLAYSWCLINVGQVIRKTRCGAEVCSEEQPVVGGFGPSPVSVAGVGFRQRGTFFSYSLNKGLGVPLLA